MQSVEQSRSIQMIQRDLKSAVWQLDKPDNQKRHFGSQHLSLFGLHSK